MFKDQLGNGDTKDPLNPDTKEALMKLSEVPLLRESLIHFIQHERVRSQLREAATRTRNALQALRFYYEKQLAARGVQPPFATSWEQLQERRYENVLARQQKELPRAFHNALLELSSRTNSDERFRQMLRPTLNGIKGMVQDAVQREVETLLDNYGTEYWDGRDVTYDNLIWGTSGIEVPIKRILFQVELVMQDAVSKFMPEAADIMADELNRTLEAHEIFSRLERAAYAQEYTYIIPGEVENAVPLSDAYRTLRQTVPDAHRDPEKVKQFQDAQNQLSGALGRLIAVSEAYPDLKSNANFLALQSQLEGTENRIAVARRDYVLRRMREDGAITEEERRAADASPVRVHAIDDPFREVAPFYAEAVRRGVVERLGNPRLLRDGLPVRTQELRGYAGRADLRTTSRLRHHDAREVADPGGYRRA